MNEKKAYVNPELNIIYELSDIITTSSAVGVSPPDIGDIDQDGWNSWG